MNYQYLSKEFVDKFDTILSRMDRCVRTDRDTYNGRCQKEVFVRRVFDKLLAGNYFATVWDEPTGLVSSAGDLKVKLKQYVAVTCASYALLKYEEKITFTLQRAGSVHLLADSSVLVNELGDIPFLPITKEKYDEVWGLFLDDRPMRNFKFQVALLDDGIKKFTLVQAGKDEAEAEKIVRVNNGGTVAVLPLGEV